MHEKYLWVVVHREEGIKGRPYRGRLRCSDQTITPLWSAISGPFGMAGYTPDVPFKKG